MEVTSQRLAAAILAPVASIAIVERGTARIDFNDTATEQERSAANAALLAFDWSPEADLAWLELKQKADAGLVFEDPKEPERRVLLALVRAIVDEFNRHATFESQMLSAIAAATSLADLKTRVDTISAVPQRTPAAVVGAIKANL
jgi:hypothetical protein